MTFNYSFIERHLDNFQSGAIINRKQWLFMCLYLSYFMRGKLYDDPQWSSPPGSLVVMTLYNALPLSNLLLTNRMWQCGGEVISVIRLQEILTSLSLEDPFYCLLSLHALLKHDATEDGPTARNWGPHTNSSWGTITTDWIWKQIFSQ